MEQYIAMLLIIMPGFVSHKIYERLNSDKRIENSFDKTVTALLYSTAIMVVNYNILNTKYKFTTLVDIRNMFNNLNFIKNYITITIISCFFVAVIWNIIHPRLTTRMVNIVRWIERKSPVGAKDYVWDYIFNDKNLHEKAVMIEKNGNFIGRGYINCFSYDKNILKEIYINRIAFLEQNSDQYSKFKGIYIDNENNLIIKEYDLSEITLMNKSEQKTEPIEGNT